MKNTKGGKSKQATSHRESTQGLKRKCEKGKEQHNPEAECLKRDERNNSLDFSGSGIEMTSSHSNNDEGLKFANTIPHDEKEFSSLIYMSKRINQETK